MRVPRWLKRMLARHRLSKRYVCEMSDLATDYHDYPDSRAAFPSHFGRMTCARCGKTFHI